MHLLKSHEQPQWLERHLEHLISIVLGGLWGDEGKGKIVDWLMENSDVVIRFNGGHNAGHTVVDEKGQNFDLHILPSGSVRSGKINIITSGCVLGLDLPKIDLGKMMCTSSEEGLVFPQTLNDLYKKYDKTDMMAGKEKNKPVRVGLIPELEQLTRKGVNIKQEPVRISAQTPIIGAHHVLLDALSEEIRASKGMRRIGSTGSGIAPAYASKNEDNAFSLDILLNNPDNYYDAVRSLWAGNEHHFPNISCDELVALAQEDHDRLKGLVSEKKITILDDEQEYIQDLKNQGKKIVVEGAQGALISANYSPFGTSSNPSIETFCTVTGIDPTSIANLFTVFKMPPSSVGTRPQFIAYLESEILARLRARYNEVGVSSGRPRDLMGYSLPEFARSMALMIGNVAFPMDRVVPVFNRIDGIPDFAQLERGGLHVVQGWKYSDTIVDVLVGIHDENKLITPDHALKNYPDRATMGSEEVFGVRPCDLSLRRVLGEMNEKQTPEQISEGVRNLLGMVLASMLDGEYCPEAILGFGPGRHDSHVFSDIEMKR